jgi:hypothetical protein
MEAAIDDNQPNGHSESLGDIAGDNCKNFTDENDVVDDEIDENDEDVMSITSEASLIVAKHDNICDNSRVAISKAFLEAEGLEETLFSAHKKMPISLNEDGSGGFDAYFAATLPTTDGNVLLLENGDIYGEFIFLIGLQVKKGTDLQLVFINSTWLAKCPNESEGIDAMKAVEGKTTCIIVSFLSNYNRLINLLSFFSPNFG